MICLMLILIVSDCTEQMIYSIPKVHYASSKKQSNSKYDGSTAYEFQMANVFFSVAKTEHSTS